jgi:hypothetical protein
MSDENETVEANAVLIFQDSDGKTWLSGAFIGELIAEKGPHQHSEPAETMPLQAMLDRAMVLVGFKVVNKSGSG